MYAALTLVLLTLLVNVAGELVLRHTQKNHQRDTLSIMSAAIDSAPNLSIKGGFWLGSLSPGSEYVLDRGFCVGCSFF